MDEKTNGDCKSLIIFPYIYIKHCYCIVELLILQTAVAYSFLNLLLLYSFNRFLFHTYFLWYIQIQRNHIIFNRLANLDRSEEQTQKEKIRREKTQGKKKGRRTKNEDKYKKKKYENYKQIRNMKINFNSQPFFLLHVFEETRRRRFQIFEKKIYIYNNWYNFFSTAYNNKWNIWDLKY